LPAAIDTLEYLVYVTLRENFLHGPLPRFAASQYLKQIDISMNNFSGEIPEEWETFSDLEELEFG